MEKINKFLARSKTFTNFDKRRDHPKPKQDDSSDENKSPKSPKLPYEYLAKVSNPSNPQGTLKRSEKENLKRSKIKQITGLAQRNSFSQEDVTLRQSTSSSPKPSRQRTKTMFDFFSNKSRKQQSPLPSKKSSTLKLPNQSAEDLNKSTHLRPTPVLDNRRADLNLPPFVVNRKTEMMHKSPFLDKRKIDMETVLRTAASPKPKRKDSVFLVRKKPELSSVEIDISDIGAKRSQLAYMRMISRSMVDIPVPQSVKNLKDQFEDMPIMGSSSIISKGHHIDVIHENISRRRRSSLPADFKDDKIGTASEKPKRDKTMANPQFSYGSTSFKNSQSDLTPKSPTKLAEFNASEDSPKTATSKKSIKNILQKFLNRRPSQQELVTKGIIQDQRIFGNSLRNLCVQLPVGRKVPEFVSLLIEMIEVETNVKSHGIYRASGNIATIQKIRIRVNEKNSLDILKDYKKDVDVLTGSLKMFFRELTEPLVSTEMFKALCDLKDKALTDHDRLYAEVDKIIKRQPDYHKDVLTVLIKHILYVNSFGDVNSMSIESMSIVWGPSLIFTDTEDSGMLLQQLTNNNSVIKFLLNIYNNSYTPTKYKPLGLYKTESTLSLASTLEKSTSGRPSFKRQNSVDESFTIEELRILVKSIQDSEIAQRNNVYVMYKGKKMKKISERIKAKKSIEKYINTKDGLCGIVETLKSSVYHAGVIPADFLKDYDGCSQSNKEVEDALDKLPTIKHQTLDLILTHLNYMRKTNSDKYPMYLLLQTWTKILFKHYPDNVLDNCSKYLEELLNYKQKTMEIEREHNALTNLMLNALTENAQFRSRLSESDSSVDNDIVKRQSVDSIADVELRKSSLYLLREDDERRKNNRNS